jgi:hypothetical protein
MPWIKAAAPIADRHSWHLSALSEALASPRASASCYRCSKDVRVLAVVVAEAKFRDVQRHIFSAHVVEIANDAAFHERPEAFNGLSVDCADNVLPPRVIDGAVRELFAKMLIANPFVGREQADFGRDGFAN